MGNGTSTQNKLDKGLMQKYRESTKLSEEEIQEWYQEFHKECPNEKLTKDKFIRIFVKYFRRRHARWLSEAIFNAYAHNDDDKDTLNFEEFLIAVSPPSQLEFKVHLNLLFDVYDTSQDGRLNREELEKMVQVMYDLVDPVEPVDKEQIVEIANDIIRDIILKLENYTGDENFKRALIIEGCYNNRDIRLLLAPNTSGKEEPAKRTDAESPTDGSKSPTDSTQEKKSSSIVQPRPVGNMSNSERKPPGSPYQRPTSKNQIHAKQEQNTKTFK